MVQKSDSYHSCKTILLYIEWVILLKSFKRRPYFLAGQERQTKEQQSERIWKEQVEGGRVRTGWLHHDPGIQKA